MLTPEPGMTVGGKYRILRLLGEGGMGAVYEAENTLTLKRAAIKWLHPRLVAVEEAGKRLLHEARATARVRHRNVVDIYDIVAEQSSVFLVMELLQGEQLSTLLAREPMTMAELIRLLLPAMQGVAAAHAAGVIHRDIKPDNILLVREPGDGRLIPKVIDFGISRVFEADSRLTRSGMTMGTPRYVSYEQLRGARDVDHRTDVYAFGVILYECLVGQTPYQASTLGEQAISFVTTEPPRPSKVRAQTPEGLDALIYAAIAKDRDERLANMEALIAALTPFAEESAYLEPMTVLCPVEPDAQTADSQLGDGSTPYANTPAMYQLPGHRAAAATPSVPSAKPSSRQRWLALTLAAGGLAALATLASWNHSSRQAPARKPSAAPAALVRPQYLAKPTQGFTLPSAPLPTVVDASLPYVIGGASSDQAAEQRVRAPRRPRSGVHVPTRTATLLSDEVAAPAPAVSAKEPEQTDADQIHRAGPLEHSEF